MGSFSMHVTESDYIIHVWRFILEKLNFQVFHELGKIYQTFALETNFDFLLHLPGLCFGLLEKLQDDLFTEFELLKNKALYSIL